MTGNIPRSPQPQPQPGAGLPPTPPSKPEHLKAKGYGRNISPNTNKAGDASARLATRALPQPPDHKPHQPHANRQLPPNEVRAADKTNHNRPLPPTPQTPALLPRGAPPALLPKPIQRQTVAPQTPPPALPPRPVVKTPTQNNPIPTPTPKPVAPQPFKSQNPIPVPPTIQKPAPQRPLSPDPFAKQTLQPILRTYHEEAKIKNNATKHADYQEIDQLVSQLTTGKKLMMRQGKINIEDSRNNMFGTAGKSKESQEAMLHILHNIHSEILAGGLTYKDKDGFEHKVITLLDKLARTPYAQNVMKQNPQIKAEFDKCRASFEDKKRLSEKKELDAKEPVLKSKMGRIKGLALPAQPFTPGKEEKAVYALDEIFTTERSFSNQLKELLDSQILETLRDKGFLSPDFYKELKDAYTDMQKASAQMTEKLKVLAENNRLSPKEKLKAYMEIMSHPDATTYFIAMAKVAATFKKSSNLLMEMNKKPEGQALLRAFQDENSGLLGLDSIFITPVQRAPRHVLLSNEVKGLVPQGSIAGNALQDISDYMAYNASKVNVSV